MKMYCLLEMFENIIDVSTLLNILRNGAKGYEFKTMVDFDSLEERMTLDEYLMLDSFHPYVPSEKISVIVRITGDYSITNLRNIIDVCLKNKLTKYEYEIKPKYKTLIDTKIIQGCENVELSWLMEIIIYKKN